MRKLRTTDVFAGMRLVKKAGLKETVQRIAALAKERKREESEEGEGVNIEELGIDMVLGIIENLAEVGAEQKVYEFLAGPLEKTVEELKNMEVLELIEMMKSYKEVENVDGWKAFFQSLLRLMK